MLVGSLAAVVTRRPLLLLALAVVALALVTGWARAGQSPATASSSTRLAGVTAPAWPAPVDSTASPTSGDVDGDVGTADDGDGIASAAAAAPGSPSVEDDIGGGDAQPCVVRADCGGALVLGGLVLALALPAAAPTIGGLAPATVVVNPAPGWRPTLRSGRFFRPPRPA